MLGAWLTDQYYQVLSKYFSEQKCHNLGDKMFIFWADKKYYCAL